MGKCKACGKFLSSTDVATCESCSNQFHKLCMGLAAKAKVTSTWHCPTCYKTPERANSQEEDVAEQLFRTLVVSGSSEDLVFNFRTELGLATENNMKNMRREFQLLRGDMGERISNLEKQVTPIEETQKRLTAPTSDMKEIIEEFKMLQLNINGKEQELPLKDVDITSLPEVNDENPVHTALLVATKNGLNIGEREIVSAERVGPRRINESVTKVGLLPIRPRSLVVGLTRRDLRDQMLASARPRRGASSAVLNMPGPSMRFYVNERLTKQNRQLFRRAREPGHRIGWRYIWTRRGHILARQKPGDSACLVSSEADLQRAVGTSIDSSK